MNRARVHLLVDEILDAIEASETTPAEPSRPRAKVLRSPPQDDPPMTEIEKARARKALRRLGVKA